tara:strand:+ start:203 stop:1234 length:1032 start_codon:yes stop_codon:yes gene_type:complete
MKQMRNLQEGPFDSKSEMNPIVRKAFAKVNRFMKGIEPQAKDEGVPDAAYEVLIKLSDEEKKAFLKVIKSLTLLTSGNVELVRSAGKGWEPHKSGRWKSVFSNVSGAVATLLGFDINEKVTAEDYRQASVNLDQIANRSNIEFVGRDEYPFASTKPEDVAAGKRGAKRDKTRHDATEISFLFRGLHELPKSVVRYMLTTGNIELGRACSSSTDLKIAMAYARPKGDGFSALFIMKNPKKIGLDAREFSKFENESEIIVRGTLEVDKVYLKSYSTMGGSSDADSVLEADGQESIFDSAEKNKMIELINMGDRVNDQHLDELGHFSARNFKKGHGLFFVFKGTIK